MKLIVKESIYYDLQEALRDDLDPDMQDAIRRIHPDEAEMILDSDHIPATDKIPNVELPCKLDIKVTNKITTSTGLGKINGIFLRKLFQINNNLHNILSYLYYREHISQYDTIDPNAYRGNKIFCNNFISVLLNLEYVTTDELMRVLSYLKSSIPVFKVRYNLYSNYIHPTVSFDYNIQGTQIGGLIKRQCKNILIGLKKIERENPAQIIKNEIAKIESISNTEINTNNKYFDRYITRGVPTDLEDLRRYYFNDTFSDLDLTGFTRQFNRTEDILSDFVFLITDNPKEKMKMGVSPFYTSCQNYLTGSHNGQLLLNLFDENSKVAILKTNAGENVSRVILRYFSAENTDNDEPLIFIDKYYGVLEARSEFFNLLKLQLDKSGLTYTRNEERVKKHVFQLKKALDRIGLKSQGSLKLPYMDTLKMETE